MYPSKARLIVAALLSAVIAGTAVLALFLLASRAALDREVATATDRVANAFRRGHLLENPYQEGSTTIGSHQWNDCLIAAMAIDQRGEPDRLALSPIIAGFDGLPEGEGDNPCAILKLLAAGVTPDAERYYYDRYVHGATVLLRFLLPHFGINQIRKLYRAMLSIVLVASLALTLFGIARGGRVVEFTALAIIILAVMRFFGLESFSQSLGHGPADLVVGVYLLGVVIMLFAPAGPLMRIVAASVFGAFTMLFELFTGGIPLGLAVVIGLTGFGMRQHDPPRHFILAACAAAAFLGTAAVVYACKIAAVVYLDGGSIVADVLGRLLYYSPASGAGPSLAPAAVAVGKSIGVLAGGMTLLSAATVVIAVIAGTYGLAVMLRTSVDPGSRQRAILLAVSVLPIPLWLMIFSNQTTVHAWFMDRIAVWVIAAGFSLFFMAVAVRCRGGSHGG